MNRQPEAPVAVNDAAELEVVGLTHEGEGVGRVEGYTVFVPGALPGERVRARVTETKKRYGQAELLAVLAPSASRIAPPCPVYSRCGGCQLQHLAYDAQLVWKRRLVVDALERIGKLKVARGSSPFSQTAGEGDASGGSLQGDSRGSVVVHPVIGMEDPWRYRNKAQMPIGFDLAEGGLVGGFYEAGTHRIVDTDACLIQHEAIENAVAAVKRIARELGIEAYDERSRTGWLRHVAAKVSFSSGELLVVLVGTSREVERLADFVSRIREALPRAAGILLNVNAERTSEVFGCVM